MLTKQNLELMLNLLEITALERIDSKCRQDAYLHGHHPLLGYSQEALTEYASAIYRYILPHFYTMEFTEAQYIAKWISPYNELQAHLASKVGSFISTLEAIASNPFIDPYPKIIVEPEYDLYKQISDFLNKQNDFYADTTDFLCNTHSPLRSSFVADSQVLALIAEVDAIRDAYNKKLEAFAVKHTGYTEKTEVIEGPKGEEKVRYKVAVDKIVYGTELKHLRQLVEARLNYYKLNPKTIALLKAHKSQIPQADWEEISKALENKVITAEVSKLITATKKAIKNGIITTAPPVVPVEEVDTIDLNEAFIRGFIQQLASAYAMPVINDPEEPPTTKELLDDVYTTIDALYTAHTQGTNLDAVQSQQVASEAWYSNFNSISQPLTACLQITLNIISPSVVLSGEVLNHGGIQGILAFTKQIHNPKVYDYDYSRLAKELRHLLQTHTAYYTDLTPLPQVLPLTKEQLALAVRGTALQDTAFNITKFIQPNIDTLKPTTALTECVEIPLLSAKDLDALIPIPDRTITQLLSLTCGIGTTPVMLNGSLLAHTKDGKYLKILPYKADDGYTSYKFTAVNYKALNWLIDKYCELLYKIPAFAGLIGYQRDAGEALFGINPDYDYTLTKADTELVKHFKGLDADTTDFTDDAGDADINSHSLAVLNALLKSRMLASQDYLSLTTIPDKQKSLACLYDDDVKLFAYLRDVTSRVYSDLDLHYHVSYTKYYDPTYFISAHHLSKWMADPKEYTEKITYGDGKWSIDHIKQGIEYRSNNDPKNLSIELADYNSGRTSRSIKVTYQDTDYVSLSSYCDNTGAGNAKSIKDKKNGLHSGDTFEYKDRTYTIVDNHQLTVVDKEVKASQITYNGKTYATPKAFADDLKLNYKSLSNALNDARKAGKSEFERRLSNKKYKFYMDENGDITKIM